MPTGINIGDVQQLIGKGARLLEVLPEPEYEGMHLPGALNIPLKRLNRETTAQLERARPVIVY